MAIFASTTTSGYGDPLKALSIKALEQRQRDLLAQQSAAEAKAFTPENTQTPIQGFGQLANQLGDQFRQSRADSALAAQRDELAKTIAGIDPVAGANQQQMAKIAVLDPEGFKTMLTQREEAKRQQALFGQQDKTQAEKARLDEAAAVAAETRAQARPQTELEKLTHSLGRKPTEAEVQANIKKITEGSVSEKKFITDQQEKSVAGQSLLGTLDEALALTNHPKGIHAGAQGGMTQSIGENTPKILQGSSMLPDPETTANTQRFNQIMGEQALNLLNQMKGASSDRDVQVNFKIANDANATVENKRKAIMWLQAKVGSLLQVHNNSIIEAGGTVPTMPKPNVGGTATPQSSTAATPQATATADVPRPAGKTDSELIAEAEAAKKAGKPAAAVDAQLQKWLMGK
jgi:hypothetical protein